MSKGRILVLALLLFLPGCYMPGINLNADHQASSVAAQSLGAKVCRLEFSSTTPTSAMDADIAALRDRGCRPLLLAGIPLMASFNDATAQLGNWSDRYGPGGSFGLPANLAVTDIEFGNETSYAQGLGGNWWNDPAYIARARNYGLRFAQAAYVVTAGNDAVGIMAQGDSGGSLSPNWVDNIYIGCNCPIHGLASGFTVHPYGPPANQTPKLNRLIQDLANHGAPSGEPIDVTEYGIATDNGVALTNNYGWPVNLTYAQAATSLEQGVSNIRGVVGDRLRYMLLYQAKDNQPTHTTTNREAYFGGLQSNNAEKGAYSTEVRDQLDE